MSKEENQQLNMFAEVNQHGEPVTQIPKGTLLKRGQMWCPYCNRPVIFRKDRELGVNRCPYCKISDHDFNVKSVNQRR